MTPLQPRLQLDLGNRTGLFFHLDQKLHPKFLMRHFAAAKAKRNLYLIAFLEKFLNGTHLNFIVMRIDVGTELDFLDLYSLLFFARLSCFLLSLELVLSEVHDLANGDFPIDCNLNKIKSGFLGLGKRVALIDRSVVFPMLINELNVTGDNTIVYARPFLSGRASDWTAYVNLLSLLIGLPGTSFELPAPYKMRIKTR